ncbi:MAG TPA: putative DNA modification/repair radical SAM protein [Polaromonas sp.]|uniref:putative DNA modification/repair radical SAM protein n=1 Tax=Polaromonas sp. TaxID=1869339 RepID=UPI002D3473AE|nr:putative DNA modification/repair radical SAM protein [Polaromonas sp.]HYW55529.1 putative DNA modification/repair radical SAM protein [Polaromonas sp.]
MNTQQKLAILADAAKYDASCASSGTSKRNSVGGKGIGSTEGSGICHSYAPDGRCISLLKILFTNFCQYDCLYCVNRVTSNVPRARFSVDEVVQLTLDFYRRNCIEGLFLSSGIIQSPDYTMEQVVEVARVLREEHDFRGYIHLKTIPDASPELLARAGRYADRLSINIEFPTVQSLESLAPEKDSGAIRRSMARIRVHIDDAKGGAHEAARSSSVTLPRGLAKRAQAPRFAPAGQSTQMIVGADATSDSTILATTATLYSAYRLRRVYYSAFSPIPDASSSLPLRQPPLIREHRLYQADWLIRFYGFAHDEIVVPSNTGANSSRADGMLALDMDPKLAWALGHREQFPVDINKAPREMLLRVPGLGVKAVTRILQARRVRKLRADDMLRLHVPLKKVMPFVLLADHQPGTSLDALNLASRLTPAPQQAGLFDECVTAPPQEQHAPALLSPIPTASRTPLLTAPLPTRALPTLAATSALSREVRSDAWV